MTEQSLTLALKCQPIPKTDMSTDEPHIWSREHLLHLLAEAAELEHNLLCSYLFATFSLKQSLEEDLLPDELAAIERWRGELLKVCLEEMTHLAQVANLTVSIGSRPHFDRPNLPVAPGYHPASIRVDLMPFSIDTLNHFIFLERPEGAADEDIVEFRTPAAEDRRAQVGFLMPSAPDYATIGAFYGVLAQGFISVSERLGEKALFIGQPTYQLAASDLHVDELLVVFDLATATRAIEFIVVQGEGSSGQDEDSHYQTFIGIRREYEQFSARRSTFNPCRPVARNPVMRYPQAADRVHVTGRHSAPLLDAANAVYAVMLRSLAELFTVSRDQASARAALLGCAMASMKALSAMSSALTLLPADDSEAGVNAGMTFTMLRSTEGVAPSVAATGVLRERVVDIRQRLPSLHLPRQTVHGLLEVFAEVETNLTQALLDQ